MSEEIEATNDEQPEGSLDSLIEWKLSSKTTVKVKELNGRECRFADRLNGLDRQTMVWTRALCSIREINGMKRKSMPQTALAVDALAQKFTTREYDKLGDLYAATFMSEENLVEEVGND